MVVQLGVLVGPLTVGARSVTDFWDPFLLSGLPI